MKETTADAISCYQNNINNVADFYESLHFEDIHNQLLNRLHIFQPGGIDAAKAVDDFTDVVQQLVVRHHHGKP